MNRILIPLAAATNSPPSLITHAHQLATKSILLRFQHNKLHAMLDLINVSREVYFQEHNAHLKDFYV